MILLCAPRILWWRVRGAHIPQWRGFDKDVHLLADVYRKRFWLKTVNRLEAARVNALGAFAGERSFRNDIRLDADELQIGREIAIASKKSLGARIGLQPPRVVLVNIDADIQRFHIAQ